MMSGWLYFWTLVAIGCLLWYSSATIYIAIRGALDIRSMLAHLKQTNAADTEEPSRADIG